MTKKQQIQLNQLTEWLSEVVNQPTRLMESNFGDTFAIYTTNENGILIDKLIGYGKVKTLIDEYWLFIKAFHYGEESVYNKHKNIKK